MTHNQLHNCLALLLPIGAARLIMSCRQVRLAGDRYVLVEYGPMELDLNLRVRIWALQAHLAEAKVNNAAAVGCLRPVVQFFEPPAHTEMSGCLRNVVQSALKCLWT